jgi:hypothetical protein
MLKMQSLASEQFCSVLHPLFPAQQPFAVLSARRCHVSHLPRLQGTDLLCGRIPHFVDDLFKLLAFTGLGEEVRCEQFVRF